MSTFNTVKVHVLPQARPCTYTLGEGDDVLFNFRGLQQHTNDSDTLILSTRGSPSNVHSDYFGYLHGTLDKNGVYSFARKERNVRLRHEKDFDAAGLFMNNLRRTLPKVRQLYVFL